jgi:uncharacterized protein YceH (UPF0502 family)
MYHFETLDDVQSAIQRLMERQPPLVRVLPRQAGTKESRYMHLFAGDAGIPAEIEPLSIAHPRHERPLDSSRLSLLENEVSALRQEVSELRQQLAEFRDQFK